MIVRAIKTKTHGIVRKSIIMPGSIIMRYEFRRNDKHFEVLSKRMYIHKDLKSYEKIGDGMLPPPPYTLHLRGVLLLYTTE